MSKLKKYKKEIKTLFYISVKNDIAKWEYCRSPYYNNSYFFIETGDFLFKLILYSEDKNGTIIVRENISTYKWLFLPINFKIWWNIMKVRNYFKNNDNNRKNVKKSKNLKLGLENMKSSFLKEVRKEKLEEIQKNELQQSLV